MQSLRRAEPKAWLGGAAALTGALVVAGVIVLAVGFSNGDTYFTVHLVNRSDVTLTTRACAASRCLGAGSTPASLIRPGRIDPETGSSTADQPVTIWASNVKPVCIDLRFATRPKAPLPIRVTNGAISVEGAPRC